MHWKISLLVFFVFFIEFVNFLSGSRISLTTKDVDASKGGQFPPPKTA